MGCGRGREINAQVGTALRIEAIHGGMRPTKTLQNLIEVRVDSPDSRSYGQKRYSRGLVRVNTADGHGGQNKTGYGDAAGREVSTVKKVKKVTKKNLWENLSSRSRFCRRRFCVLAWLAVAFADLCLLYVRPLPGMPWPWPPSQERRVRSHNMPMAFQEP